MIQYSDDDLIEAPREVLWKLLGEHLDDTKIATIHPLVQSQTTVRRSDSEVVVDRVIDVRRKLKKSRWRFVLEPPEKFRWEILESDGPWASGTYLELKYEEVPNGTHITARGSLTLVGLPFFLSQPRTVATVLNDLRTEDVFYLRRYRY